MMSNTLVAVADLRKSYGSVEVLKGLDLEFKAGEIHAFLGANGAGKSTFLGCLSGAVTPSSGEITLDGQAFDALKPRQALDHGVGIIYQHFQVFEGLSVAENIFLGRELKKFGCVDKSAQIAEARTILQRLGVSIDPRTMLDDLSTGERKIIEIARALNVHPKLLILDEPTAALGEKEMAALHDVVRQLAHSEGLGIVYVTHLLDEIDEIADVVTVLRNGSVIWTKQKEDTNPTELAEAIAPSSSAMKLSAPSIRKNGPASIELKDYRSPFTGPINLSVRPGEAIGIYGLLGSGRTDLLESLFGARAHTGGSLMLAGRPAQIKNPLAAMDKGISLVASDRTEQSLFGTLSATDNLLMPHYGRSILPSLIRKPKRERELFSDLASRLSVHPPNPALLASHFSGGNAQKIVLGRWLLNQDADSQIILLDEPTQGVDIGARNQLYETLRQALNQGACVLFATSDPTEILTLADRTLVLGYGRQVALIDSPKNEHELVELAHRTSSAIHAA